jgi:hypothetical protein
MTIFTKVPESYREAWDMIKRLVKEWHHVELVWDVTAYDSQLMGLEDRVGVRLPASLKEWYGFLQVMQETDQ